MGEASGASLPLRLAIANAPWARADHRRFPWRPTRAGRWTAIDNCTCKCFGLIADSSLLSRRVARELVAIILRRERPDTIISDNGTEYTSNAIQADDTKVYWCRAPQKNGLNESFNDRPRDGLLNETLPIPPHARAVLED